MVVCDSGTGGELLHLSGTHPPDLLPRMLAISSTVSKGTMHRTKISCGLFAPTRTTLYELPELGFEAVKLSLANC